MASGEIPPVTEDAAAFIFFHEDIRAQLREYAKLRDEKIITEQQFEEMRANLLKQAGVETQP